MMSIRSNIAALGFFGLALLLVPRNGPVFAPPPSLVIEVVPTTLELGIGETGQAQIVVRNSSGQAASDLELSWVNNTGLEIGFAEGSDFEDGRVAELPPNAEVVWSLQVSQKDQTLDAGMVHLRLDYTWTDSDAPENGPVSRLLFAELQVTTPAAEPVGEFAGVEVRSALTTLNEQRPGFVYLLLENKSDVPIRIAAIDIVVPEFIEVVSLNEDLGAVLLPHETRSLPFQVRATDVVQPQKHIILFEIDLAWEKGGLAQVGTLVASHEVDVGVFGESQLLTLLGIPAFFLLPGFLMIVAFRLLWSRGKTAEDAGKFPLPATSSEFWFVAISLSLLIAMLYPAITNLLLGVRRNYLEAYGLVDVLYLWFGSILLAVFAFTAYYGIVSLVSEYRQRERLLRTPAGNDDELATLQKLARQKLNLRRGRVRVRIDGKEYGAYALQDNPEDESGLWVAPRILITNRDQIAGIQQVYDLLDQGTDIDGFLKLSPMLRLAWAPSWPNPGCLWVAKADVVRFEEPDVMVEVS